MLAVSATHAGSDSHPGTITTKLIGPVAAASKECIRITMAAITSGMNGGFASKEPSRGLNEKKLPTLPKNTSADGKAEVKRVFVQLSGLAKHSNSVPMRLRRTRKQSSPSAIWKPCPSSELYLDNRMYIRVCISASSNSVALLILPLLTASDEAAAAAAAASGRPCVPQKDEYNARSLS